MTSTSPATTRRIMLSKVPQITVWFWAIKVLCTTVGESLADWINVTLGVGLEITAIIFTLVLAATLTWQLLIRRYVPFVYWLTVVVVSVTGTLYTDILTDVLGVPLWASTTIFAVVLAMVFGIWWRSQRTLSIHSITTTHRELFYWLAILVTFALGTAAGDWILELRGWGPGISVLFPAGLILAVAVGWRLGADSVLSFWLAYILTRPLGANLGDWMGLTKSEGGLGIGVGPTSIFFLGAIVATIVYLSIARVEDIDSPELQASVAITLKRQRAMLVYFAAIAAVAVAVLFWAHAQPHAAAAGDEGPAVSVTALAPGQSATINFPTTTVIECRTIVRDTLALVQRGKQTEAATRITDLETIWDQNQATLEGLDSNAWSVLDGQIDRVLKSLRSTTPDRAAQVDALTTLLRTLSS